MKHGRDGLAKLMTGECGSCGLHDHQQVLSDELAAGD
jgi:hypothetical protein